MRPESADSVSVTPTDDATLSVSLLNPPTENVVVRLQASSAAVMISPTELTFTPSDHAAPQDVVMIGRAGEAGEETFLITAATASDDANFDGVVDRWEYTAIRP